MECTIYIKWASCAAVRNWEFMNSRKAFCQTLIDALKKVCWSRKCRECILKAMMWGRPGNEATKLSVILDELWTLAALWETSTFAINFHWASYEVLWSSKKQCTYIKRKSALWGRSTLHFWYESLWVLDSASPQSGLYIRPLCWMLQALVSIATNCITAGNVWTW